MAKGNIFMGTLKGRVGASVFYVKQGVQNQIKHQTEVSNPKTSGQCLHRSKFSSAGKFFTHGTQALFKFAFEGKRKGESDFNAFMKANVDFAFPMSKQAIENPQYPMVNEWLITKGSLTAPICSVNLGTSNSNVAGSYDVVGTAPASITTIADLTKAIVDGVSVKENDIITFVLIHSYVDAQSYPAINPDILLQPQYAWNIAQLQLNALDTTTLASIGISASVNLGRVVMTYSRNYSKAFTSYIGGSIILSRRTPNGLKVSTNRLKVANNDEYQQNIAYVREFVKTDVYKNAVVTSWQDTPSMQNSTDIILEGALISKSSIEPTGNNPVHANASEAQATKLILPFDPREGYFSATLGQLTAADAIDAANNGELRNYYYNREARRFMAFGFLEEAIGLDITANNDGTFSIWVENGAELWFFIKSWTNVQGQTIDFAQVGE